MELTSNDYRAISEKISEGSNYVEYNKGNETIAIECKLEIDGYEENGYNGTGAFVSTSKNLCNEIFEKLAEKYDCSLYWIAEEFGLGLFQSNDSEEKYFGDDNIVIEVDGHGLEYFSSEEDAVAYVVGMTGNPNITFDELEDLDDVFVTKLEYVS